MKVLWIVLDSLGIGAMPDAPQFGDALTVNTLAHLLEAAPEEHSLPHLEKLGLLHLIGRGEGRPEAHYGRLALASNGKDTVTGHWEMTGIITEVAFPTFPNGFPEQMLDEIRRISGRGILGNTVASGTEIIKELGPAHIASGDLIVYTSADSVLQIAAHEDVVPLPELYRIAAACREAFMTPGTTVNRIICRPFIGNDPAHYERTGNRRDFAIPMPLPNALSRLKEAGVPLYAIGKIGDIYANIAFDERRKTKDNQDGILAMRDALMQHNEGLYFTNLVDFDAKYGHRRDAQGYAEALARFDQALPDLMAQLEPGDWLWITADHGCDPKAQGTDHTREYVPLLAWTPGLRAGKDLGLRTSLADWGQTLLELFHVTPALAHGNSLAADLSKGEIQ